MPRIIYALYYMDPTAVPEAKRYFYVGQSSNPDRREKEHRGLIASGTEDKYVFMRRLVEQGVTWYLERLHEVPEHSYPPDNERWWVISLCRGGHKLTNMRHGSEAHRIELAAQVDNPAIRSVADVALARTSLSLDSRGASRRFRRQLLERELKSRGIRPVSEAGLLPPALKRRLVAGNIQAIEKGVDLSSIVRIARGAKAMAALEATLVSSGSLPRPIVAPA